MNVHQGFFLIIAHTKAEVRRRFSGGATPGILSVVIAKRRDGTYWWYD
jgi:hypothetical protein